MSDSILEIQGKVDMQLQVECIRQNTDLFIGTGVNVCITDNGIYLPKGQHTHDAFEFILPISGSFVSKIEKKSVLVEQNRLFCINSEQAHGPEKDLEDFRFICVEIEKDFLADLADSIYRNTKINFANENSEENREVISAIYHLIQENRNKQQGYEFITRGLQYQIAVNILRSTRHNLHKYEKDNRMLHKSNIDKVIKFMKENSEADFSLEYLADMTKLSVFHFIRVFKSYTGKTPNEYLIELKIEKAKRLLNTQNHSVTEICFLCGFNNLSHFTETFKKKTGVTPSHFRRLMLNI